MNGGTHRHHLVRVHVALGFLLEVVLDGLPDERQPGRSTDEDDAVEVAHRQIRLLQCLVADLEASHDQVLHQRGEVGPGHGALDRARLAVWSHQDLGDANLDFFLFRQPHLDAFGLGLELLQREGVVAEVDALLGDEFIGQQIDDAVIEVVTTEEGVAAGREHLEDVMTDLQHGNVEGAPAQVVHCDALLEPPAESVGECGGGGLVEDPQHFEPGDPASVLRRLALVVIEVSRNGDDRLRYGCAQAFFGDPLHLGQDHGRDLGQRVLVLVHLDANVVVGALGDLVGADGLGARDFRREVVAPDQPLGGADRVERIVDDVCLGGVSDGDGTVLTVRDDARGRVLAVGIGQDLDLAAPCDGHTRVARSQVDSDRVIRHGVPSESFRLRCASPRAPPGFAPRSPRRPGGGRHWLDDQYRQAVAST